MFAVKHVKACERWTFTGFGEVCTQCRSWKKVFTQTQSLKNEGTVEYNPVLAVVVDHVVRNVPPLSLYGCGLRDFYYIACLQQLGYFRLVRLRFLRTPGQLIFSPLQMRQYCFLWSSKRWKASFPEERGSISFHTFHLYPDCFLFQYAHSFCVLLRSYRKLFVAIGQDVHLPQPFYLTEQIIRCKSNRCE